MDNLSAGIISEWIQGKLTGSGNAMVNKISTDTRTLEKGNLFIALRGERTDGHKYISNAFEKGASVVVCETPVTPPEGCAVITVEDTIKALKDMAKKYMGKFRIPVIGITGSVGKTTTKEMIAQILSTEYNVHKTMGNFNNHIGLPLSVLELTREHTAAVFEMGMSGLGEIEYLADIIKPDIGVITNIGISHIEKLGTRQNILRAKLEITRGMNENGKLILNGDDELLSGLKGLLPMPMIFYGINETCELNAFDIHSLGEDGVRFTVSLRNEDVDIALPAPGIHNVSNALAAIACGLELNVSNENIKKGLANYSQEKMRLNIVKYKGIKIINDSYNSAPSSAEASLSVLREVAGGNRSIAVLGDMLELGDYARKSHRQIGATVVREHISHLVAVGSLAKDYVQGALEAGMDEENTRYFKEAKQAISYLKSFLKPGDVVLFKGSRGMKLDSLIEGVFETTAFKA
jgi:UDP-N-acetylmuramoyl-tripeptide--D-alanyl-D-alanine ligase